jgi:hypothetical protein
MDSLICFVSQNKLADQSKIQAQHQREDLKDDLVIVFERTHQNYSLHESAGDFDM